MKKRLCPVFILFFMLIVLAAGIRPHKAYTLFSSLYNRALCDTKIIRANHAGLFCKKQLDLVSANKIICLSARDLLNTPPEKLKIIAENNFFCAVYTPECFSACRQKNLAFLLKTTAILAEIKAALIIDCSCADNLRQNSEGYRTIEILRKNKIRRMVIFDGGHHLLGLALQPDIIVLPALQYNGDDYACHAYVKDAACVGKILRIINTNNLNISAIRVSRLNFLAKSPGGLKELVRRTIPGFPPKTTTTPAAPPFIPEFRHHGVYSIVFLPGGDLLIRVNRPGFSLRKITEKGGNIYISGGNMLTGRPDKDPAAGISFVDMPLNAVDIIFQRSTMNMLSITIKILTGLGLLFCITKILGKTQISQITPFDFISSVVMGELFVHAVFEEKAGIFELMYPLVLWGASIYAIEFLAEKFLRARGLFEGYPSIVIRDGQIDRDQLRRNKLNLNQLLNLLRLKNIFSINEVKYAILEMNGSLSVMKNPADDLPSRKDLNLPDIPVFLPVSLIIDGKIINENLKENGLDVKWLENQLKIQGVDNVKDVFYAEWRKDKGLFLSLQKPASHK